jgi:hypothetical protein
LRIDAMLAGRKKRALVQAPEYLVEILGRRFPVSNMVDASRLVEAVRDRSGAGASEMGAEFPILENGKVVAFVSYNGRVWKGQPGTWPEGELVYDPYAKEAPITVKARVLSGTPDEEAPGVERAVEAVLRSAARQGVTTISIENSYRAVTRKTDLLDDARISGDHWLMPIYASALRRAAEARGLVVTA